MLQYVFHAGSIGAITYLFPLWVYALLDWQAREVGIVFGVVGAIMAFNQGVFMGRLLRWLGELRLLRLCISLFLGGLLLAVLAEGQFAMVTSLIISMTGSTLCMPLLNTMASHRAAPDERGRLLGAASAAAALGRVLGPLLAGGLLSLGGFRVAWLLPLLMVLCYWCWAFFALSASSARAGGTA
jgi:MFS family permease